MVRSLVPMLSKSLGEHFNVFRVMRHGTHEKQLSNVFAWLLDPHATHELGGCFQEILLTQINKSRGDEAPMPTSGYRVIQEAGVTTQAGESPDCSGKDIADIVLTQDAAAVVIENYLSSDGHGHNFARYQALGTSHSTCSVVVLLCIRRDLTLLRDGWEQAVVITYDELLTELRRQVNADKTWGRTHQEQSFFLTQLFDHFLQGTHRVSTDASIEFIKAMCDSGESIRYGYRPHMAAAQEFADLMADHAKRQFEDGRKTLAQVKKLLRQYAATTLTTQVNTSQGRDVIVGTEARFVGKWEWCITLRCAGESDLFLTFGPTARTENENAKKPLGEPDFTRIFATRGVSGPVDAIIQTDVRLDEVIRGLSPDDTRLHDALVSLLQ